MKVNIFITFVGPVGEPVEVPNKGNPCERESWQEVTESCLAFLNSMGGNELGLEVVGIRMEQVR